MPADILGGRFHLEAEIGRGGLGVVYRAHDLLLDREVAIKVLTERPGTAQDGDRLLREAQAIAKLKHPNIVLVYDACAAGGVTHVVMEHVDGTPLREHRPRDIPEIISIARQVCAALDHAHKHGIVHRDVKPENVMVAGDGTAKLMDFGLARPLQSRVTHEGTITGTAFYIAPEQALGRPVDGRADLYSLGVMLYEMVAGRLPFTADDPLAVISQHIHSPVVPPTTYNEEIPHWLEALILGLLAKDPDDRPASASEVSRTLDQAGQTALEVGQPITAMDRLVRGRFVGRRQELAQARAAWMHAVAGKSCVLLISGEPGIGKSRLADELTSQIAVTGGIVLAGECFAGGSAPYAPVAQMIEQGTARVKDGARALSDSVLADLIRLAPNLRVRYPDIPANQPFDPKTDHQRLCESVFLLLSRLALEAPLALLVEDIHWADGGTLSLLQYLASRGHGSDLAFFSLLTYRDAEVSGASALEALLQELSRLRLATHINLTRFDKEQTGELLEVMFQTEASPAVLQDIYGETEGNPFFVEEVCKTLIDQGKLVHEAGLWRYQQSPGDLTIPQDLQVAIHLRVESLPGQAQEVLRIAAVIGREFDCDVLREVSRLSEEALIEALERAERSQLIREVRAGDGAGRQGCPRFAFVHALVHHALEDGVIGLRRQRLHAQIAQALEKLRGDKLEELAPVLARHHAEAGEGARAAGYWTMAGDRALSLFAYTEAIDAHQKALEVFENQEDHERAARTLMKLGLIHQAVFEFDDAHRAFQEGSAHWQRVPPVPSTRRPAAPHAFRKNWFAITTLDPGRGDDTAAAPVSAHLFRGLIERTPEMTVLPDAARAWEVLEGGTRYVFHLREDVRWSDGVPTTARDFEYAWKRCLDPSNESVKSQFLYDIRGARAFHLGDVPTSESVGVRAIDDLTLIVDLESPVGYFLQLACHLLPVPMHVVEAYGAAWADPERIVTNGPFLLEEWQPNNRLLLARNPAFGGRFDGNLEKVEITMDRVYDDVACRQRYDAGETDWYCPQLPAEEDRARYMHPGEYFICPVALTSFLLLDPGQPPFDDTRVRKAFAHALDRVPYANVIMGGYLPCAHGGLVPPGLDGHSPGIGLSFDPAKGRDLLSAAGFPGGRGFPSVSLTKMGQREYERATKYLQAQWQAVLGVDVVIKARSTPETYMRPRAHTSHILLTGWSADYPDPDNFLRLCLEWHTDIREFKSFYELIESARRTLNQRERTSFYQQADRLIIEDAVVVPLVYGSYSFLLKPWVKRFPTSAVWNHFWKDIIIEPH